MTIPQKPLLATRSESAKLVPTVQSATSTPPVSAKVDGVEKKPVQKIRLKIVGVGGAGCNAISYMATTRAGGDSALEGVELVAVNTDLPSLQATTADERIQIGSTITHGLSAGSNPELGSRAAQADMDRLKASLQGVNIVFLVAGLGGGTGTGAAPVVARAAKEHGALVLAFVAMPFGFEGDQRRQQALTGLEHLKAQADAVVCMPNDKLFKIAGENASAADAFKHGDDIMASGARAIWQLLSRKGLINLDFAAVSSVLSSKHCDGVFSIGHGHGANKAREAVKSLLENPVLDNGDVLSRAESVLVSVLGGPDMGLGDVQRAVEQITRLAGRARIVTGAATDENYRDRMVVTVIASASVVSRRPVGHCSKPAVSVASCKEPVAKKESAKATQAELDLAHASPGQFEKSEPTLHEGQNLDVPTFLRRGMVLKR